MAMDTPDAPGSQHQAATGSVSPRQPPGQQATNEDEKTPSFAGHFEGHGGAPV